MSTNYPLVSIITVNYNQAQVTLEWLHSVRQISYPRYEIIIVDNASAETTLEKYLPAEEDIVFIKSPVNKGFAGGNNLGIQKAKGELVLLLNNDTEVEKHFLEPLVLCMLNNPQIGMISPKIKYFDQKSTIQYCGGSKINPITGRGKFIGSGKQDNEIYLGTRQTNLIHGAAMLVSRSLINKIGLMEEAFFLYYEELDWCERAKKAGYLMYVVGESVVYHKESISVGKNSPLRMFYITRNRLLFMQRNFAAFPFMVYLLFFLLISLPKNVISLFLNSRMDLLQAFLRGINAYFLLPKSSLSSTYVFNVIGTQKKVPEQVH